MAHYLSRQNRDKFTSKGLRVRSVRASVCVNQPLAAKTVYIGQTFADMLFWFHFKRSAKFCGPRIHRLDESKRSRFNAEYQDAKDQSWAEQDVAEERAFLIARAKGVDAYASGDLPKQYEAQRKSMLQAAINLWMNVVQDAVDQDAVKRAEDRIPKLQKLLDAEAN